MANDLNYECPHCQKVSPVSRATVDEMVECPQCHQQFQAKAPIGRPVGSAVTQNTGRRKIALEFDADETLRSVHPVFLRNHIVQTVLFCFVAVAGLTGMILGLSGKVLLGQQGFALIVSGIVMLVFAFGYFLYRWLQVISTRLIVTTQRTIVETGIISMSTNEVQHDDVRNMKSERNVLERLFNYGDIALSSSGQDDMEIVVHDVPDPEGIIEIIRQYQ
ncbi:MAG: PH domain-containing protein [Planctomycetaceae bacterium]|nr:PH domain-containing protein [Planctomycetaceae bacterium]